MVFLEELGLRVEVVVDNVAAEEFTTPAHANAGEDDPKSHPFMCQRYIESKVGAQFFISVEVLDSHGSLSGWMEAKENKVGLLISIDGHQYVAGGQLNYRNCKGCFEGIVNGTNKSIQKFQFAPIFPIEDATKELEMVHKEQTKELGTIQVQVYRTIKLVEKRQVNNEQSVSANGDPEVCRLAQGDEIALAEKALKGRALVHGASLAPASHLQPDQIARLAVSESRWLDPVKQPFAMVRFKYRSKDALKQELIIPRTPSPEPSPCPETKTVDDLSPQEIRRLAQERLSELQDRKRAAPCKKEEDEAAQPTRPFKYVRTAGGRQAIDLTEDD